MSTTRHGDANGTYCDPPVELKKPCTSITTWIDPPKFLTIRS
ncbi:MAG: hypothetical protein ACOYOQ_14470 [Microthrixaceae bacterium]